MAVEPEQLERHPDAQLVARASDDVGHEACALLELDQPDEHGVAEAVDLRVVGRRPRVERPAPGRDREPHVEAAAVRAPRRRREVLRRAPVAGLDPQLVAACTVPEVLVVAVDRGPRPLGGIGVARRRPVGRGSGGAAAAGPELQHPEQHASRRPRRRRGTRCRLVTKWPTPRPVCFSSLTSSRVSVLCTISPGRSGRANSSSEFTATVDVKPCAVENRQGLALRVVGVAASCAGPACPRRRASRAARRSPRTPSAAAAAASV